MITRKVNVRWLSLAVFAALLFLFMVLDELGAFG